jgi:hypothetical protein
MGECKKMYKVRTVNFANTNEDIRRQAEDISTSYLTTAAETGRAYNYGLKHDRNVDPTTNLHKFSTPFMSMACPTLRERCQCVKFKTVAENGNGYNYG